MHFVIIYFCANNSFLYIKNSFALKAYHNLSETKKQWTMVRRFQSIFSRSERTYDENPKIVTTTRVSMDEEDSFENAGGELTPLSAVADAFEDLSAPMKSKDCNFDIRLKPFCDTCPLVSVLFASLSIAFKFAELEYVSKVSDLSDASKGYATLNNILNFDVKHETVRIQGSLSRKLHTELGMVSISLEPYSKKICQHGMRLTKAASIAYAKTCAPYHPWGSQDCSFCWYVCPAEEGTATVKAK